MTLSESDLRTLLARAFEAGHWAWPTPHQPTRDILREAAVDRILEQHRDESTRTEPAKEAI